jgi:REP element-mobilizing transposase RayT
VKPEPQKPLETPEFIFPWEETTSSINSHAAPTIPLRIRDFQPPQERPKSIPLPVPADLEATRQTSRVGAPAPAAQPAAQPEVEKPLTNLSQMESALPGLSHLAYTCILVPRMPNHYLNGELAEKLGIWTPQLCLAFGWRLEALSIRPSYLQWNVRVLPAVSPGALLRILRQRLSERIFAAFPKLRGQNPSGDFWAQGYLIISGSTPPSNQLVQDYIQQTRQRQGLSSK